MFVIFSSQFLLNALCFAIFFYSSHKICMEIVTIRILISLKIRLKISIVNEILIGKRDASVGFATFLSGAYGKHLKAHILCVFISYLNKYSIKSLWFVASVCLRMKT